MRLRIWKAKCMLVHHLKGLETNTLATWSIGRTSGQICADLDIEDANTTLMSKLSFKNMVEKACRKKDQPIL